MISYNIPHVDDVIKNGKEDLVKSHDIWSVNFQW